MEWQPGELFSLCPYMYLASLPFTCKENVAEFLPTGSVFLCGRHRAWLCAWVTFVPGGAQQEQAGKPLACSEYPLSAGKNYVQPANFLKINTVVPLL